MTISRFQVAGRVAGLLLVIASVAAAQRPMQIPKDNFNSAGRVKGLQNGVFHVQNVGGNQWFVRVEAPAEKIVLRATATPAWLRPGMPVQFQGNFAKNKSGRPQGVCREPITKLKVFSPREDSKVVLREELKRGSFLTSSEPEGPMEVVPFTVSGVLTKYKNGRMTVTTTGTEVEAILDDKAEITVDVSDYRLARAGDEIEFEGWHYVGQKEQIHATRVWITAKQPLGEEEQRAANARLVSGSEASEEQQDAARQIHTSIVRVRKAFEAGHYRDAAATIESIIADLDDFIGSGDEAAVQLVRDDYQQLKAVHAGLEMEGFMLPVLREPPDAAPSGTIPGDLP